MSVKKKGSGLMIDPSVILQVGRLESDGYYGGVRLLMASVCTRGISHCLMIHQLLRKMASVCTKGISHCLMIQKHPSSGRICSLSFLLFVVDIQWLTRLRILDLITT